MTYTVDTGCSGSASSVGGAASTGSADVVVVVSTVAGTGSTGTGSTVVASTGVVVVGCSSS